MEPDSEKLARLMSTISCEGVGVLWDVHHPYRFMHEKPETTYQNLRPWLCHTHFKDSTATADGYRYALPGFGDVPLEEIVGVLKDGGYDGFYSLEWSSAGIRRWRNRASSLRTLPTICARSDGAIAGSLVRGGRRRAAAPL